MIRSTGDDAGNRDDEPGGRLTQAQLAARAASSEERIERLVRIGVLRPDDDGRFSAADAQRVEIVAAYEAGGIGLDDIALAVREDRVTFDYSDRIYPPPSPPASGDIGQLSERLGASGKLVPELFLALGLPRPDPDRRLTQDEERLLPAFFEAWSADGMSSDAPLRAARLLGDAARRAAAGWVGLFTDAVGLRPPDRATMSMDTLRPRMFEPAVRVAEIFEPMTVWLLRRHLEQALNGLNVESMERALEANGVRPKVDDQPPAAVFADLSGFTRLTEREGDESAVRHASTLSGLAIGVASANGGRLVKQLGDGVMLVFRRADEAVGAAIELRAAASGTDLPPLHIGISAGPMVERDGDYFGRTVNLASRLSSVAGPGEIVVDETAADVPTGVRVVALGPTTLKGMTGPVPIFRVETIAAE